MTSDPLFHQIELRETLGLLPFRQVIGKANFELNTLRAGLIQLSALPAPPPMPFAIVWAPGDLTAAANDAHAFAVRSLLVYATDVVDRYMRKLAESETLIPSADTRSLLLAEFQAVRPTRPASRKDTESLARALLEPGSDVEGLIQTFRELHLHRQRRPGLRERFDKLMSLCPSVPPHHRAAFHLLVALRNRHAHGQSNDTVSPTVAADWAAGYAQLSVTHPRSTPADLFARFTARQDPTADDLTTLIALLHRTITVGDADIVRAVNAEAYAEEAMAGVLKAKGADDTTKKYWGRSERSRATKLMSLTMGHGFYRHVRTQAPAGINVVHDDLWRELAGLSRSDFLSRITTS